MPSTVVVHVDAGTWPEWLAAIGTVGALLVSLGLLTMTLVDRHRDSIERERQAAAQRREQASKVRISPPIMHGSSVEALPRRRSDDESWPRMVRRTIGITVPIRNESADRIFAMHAEMFCPQLGRSSRFEGVNDQGERLPQDEIAAGATFSHFESFQAEVPSRESVLPDPGPVRVVITFRDAAGLTWRRDSDGRLEEIPSLSVA